MNSSDLENRPLLAESRLPTPSLAGSMMFYVHLRKCSMMLSSIAYSIYGFLIWKKQENKGNIKKQHLKTEKNRKQNR